MQTQHTGCGTRRARNTTDIRVRAKRRWSSHLAPMAIVLFTLCWTAASTRASILAQVAKLLASDGEEGDLFGYSVSISGDTVIVGALGDSDNGNTSGSAYVFVRDKTGVWTQQAKLLPSDGKHGNEFGISVAISGDTAIAGEFLDNEKGMNSGAAYIFTRDPLGVWSQQTKLMASDEAAGDTFGISVSISGDITIIGASGNSDHGLHAGAAYIFVRDDTGVWKQQAKLFTTDGDGGNDSFGRSVSISGRTAIIGQGGNDDNGLDAGAAYIFADDDAGVWTQQAKLVAPDANAKDWFGLMVAISGDTAIVGANKDDDNGLDSGSAYIFARDAAGVWTQQAKLLAPDGAAGSSFGDTVAISGDRAIVGAIIKNEYGPSARSAYVFVRDPAGIWRQRAKLFSSNGIPSIMCCGPIGLSGAMAIIGVPSDDDNGFGSGASYLFDLTHLSSCLNDINGDGVVDAVDRAILLAQWGGPGVADINNDGVVNASDLAGLLANLGPCP